MSKKDELKNETKETDETKETNEIKGKENEIKGKEKDTKKGKDQEDKTVIPNTMTVLIDTRIPNHSKFIFDPSMTVTTSKSNTVYFDPLVKYNQKAIYDLPPTAPKELKYTQFFEANQFDSLINRFYGGIFMQKKRKLDEAIKEGIITNNVELTLHSLFKTNGILYIDKRPYTILSMHRKGNWYVDTKPNNNLMTQYSNSSYKDVIEDADNELKQFKNLYPNGMGDLDEKDKAILDSINSTNVNTSQSIDIFDGDKNNDEYSETFKEEINFITPNSPIFKNGTELLSAVDPLTFSLFLDVEELKKYLSSNVDDAKKKTIETFGAYMQKKKALFDLNKEYNEVKKETGLAQQLYDAQSIMIFNILVSLNGRLNLPEEVKEQTESLKSIPELFEQLYVYSRELLQLLIKLFETLKNVYDAQIIYFDSIVTFLKEYKNSYARIIDYYEDKSELADMCINEDIRIYELLSAQTPKNEEDKNSKNYFKNKKELEEKIKGLKKEEQFRDTVNIDEMLETYLENPYLLITTRKQMGIYYSINSMSYYVNQLNIWKIYFAGTEKLVSDVSEYYISTMDKIGVFEIQNPNISDDVSRDFPTFSKVKQTNTSAVVNWFVGKKSKPKWILVDDEDKPIVDDKPIIYEDNEDIYKIQLKKNTEKKYIEFFKLETNLYDCIVLTTHLLQIKCLRQYSLYIAEKNVTNVNLMILKLYFIYASSMLLFKIDADDNKINKMYDALKDMDDAYKNEMEMEDLDNYVKEFIRFNNGIIHYPDISDIATAVPFNIGAILANPIKQPYTLLLKNLKGPSTEINVFLTDIFIDIFIQNYKTMYIKNTLLEKCFDDCEKIKKILYPTIGEKGLINMCENFLDKVNQFSDATRMITISDSFNKEITTSNIDIQQTNKLNEVLLECLQIKSEFKAWFVLNQENQLKKYNTEAFLNCICDVLNKQLDKLNAITINYYADINTNKFTYKRFAEIFKNNIIGLTIRQLNIDLDINICILMYDTNTNRIITVEEPGNINQDVILLLKTTDDTNGIIYEIIEDIEGNCMFDRSVIDYFNKCAPVPLSELSSGLSSELSSGLSSELSSGPSLLSETKNAESLTDAEAHPLSSSPPGKPDTVEPVTPIKTELEYILEGLDSNSSLIKIKDKINTLTTQIKKMEQEIKSGRQNGRKISQAQIDSIETEKIRTEASLQKKYNEIARKLKEILQAENKIQTIKDQWLAFKENFKQNYSDLPSSKFKKELKLFELIRNNYLKFIPDEPEKYGLLEYDETKKTIEKIKVINKEARDILSLIKSLERARDQNKPKITSDIQKKWAEFNARLTANPDLLQNRELMLTMRDIENEAGRQKIILVPSLEGGGFDSDSDSDSEEEDFIGGDKYSDNYAAQSKYMYPYGQNYAGPGAYVPATNYNSGPMPPNYGPNYGPMPPNFGPNYGPMPMPPNYGPNYGPNYSMPVNQNLTPAQINQQNMDYYNYQYNFSKSTKSKLSYYVTIELELYPGTHVGTVKRYAMKCQTAFERIRKSWADLFGYEYRPRALKEAYGYEEEYDLNQKMEEEMKKNGEKEKDEDGEKEEDGERKKEKRGKRGGDSYKSKGKSKGKKSNKTCKNKSKNKSKRRSLKRIKL